MVIWKDYVQDLDKDIVVRDDDYKLLNRNQKSNGIRVTLTHGGEAADLTGLTCHGYVLCCKSGVTYHVYGSSTAGIGGEDMDNNQAWIIIPNDAYLVPGLVVVTIMLSTNSGATGTSAEFATVLSVRMVVEKVVSDDQREPSSVAVQIENIAQMYTQMETAKSGAEAAAAFVPNMIAPVYDGTRGYSRGEYMVKDNYLYVAMNDVAANAAYSTNDFASVKAGEALMLNPKYIRYFFDWQFTHSGSNNTFNGTYKFMGGTFILNGSTEANSGASIAFDMTSTNGNVYYTSSTKITTNHSSLILSDGHRYRLRTRNISGTCSSSTSLPYARFAKVTRSEATNLTSSYLGKIFTDRSTGDVCCDITYDSTTMPDGIMIALYTSRSGGPVWNNYTCEVTLSDITYDFENGYIAPVEATPALYAHNVGDLIMLNQCLFKVTTAINVGEDIKTGANANVEKTSIAEELANIRTLLN